MKYAEVNAEGTVTKIVDDSADYTAPEGSFLVEGGNFVEGQKYQPTAGNPIVTVTSIKVAGTVAEVAPVAPAPVEE